MIDNDWTQVAAVLGELWPQKVERLTKEQAMAYQRACADAEPDVACEALRSLVNLSPYFPSPFEFRQALKSATRRSPEVQAHTTSDTLRARWQREDPAQSEHYASLDNDSISLLEARTHYENSARLYGPAAPATVRHWLLWQNLRHQLGDRQTKLPVDHTSVEALAAFHEESSGASHAQAIWSRAHPLINRPPSTRTIGRKSPQSQSCPNVAPTPETKRIRHEQTAS